LVEGPRRVHNPQGRELTLEEASGLALERLAEMGEMSDRPA
jgi:hypothetical protein